MDIERVKAVGEQIKSVLLDNGTYEELVYPEPVLEDGRISYGASYPIKAFEKFLGYYDSGNKIAYNPSISFNTDFSFCLSSCQYMKSGNSDTVVLDGIVNDNYQKKAKEALSGFKRKFKFAGSFNFYMKRYKKYGNAKGMSESSAVASAASRSLITNAFNEKAEIMDHLTSRFARLISGSGTRASINGLSIWLSYPGIDPDQSFAVKVKENPRELYYGIFPKQNSIRTDQAHKAVKESIFYDSWIYNKIDSSKIAADNNFDTQYLIKRGQEDSLNLHSVLLSSGLLAQTGESMELLRKITGFQSRNEGVYFNSDTGPSIMISSLDRKLLQECRNFVNEDFLEGGMKYDSHLSKMKEFQAEANEYFKSI